MIERRIVPVLLAALLAALLTVPASAESGPLTAHVTVGSAPAQLTIELSVRDAHAGRTTRATAVLRNDGEQPIHDLSVTLHVPETHVQVREASVTLDVLAPRRQTRVVWDLCSTRPGSYLIVARAQARSAGGSVEVESTAVELTVRAPPGRAPVSCPAW